MIDGSIKPPFADCAHTAMSLLRLSLTQDRSSEAFHQILATAAFLTWSLDLPLVAHQIIRRHSAHTELGQMVHSACLAGVKPRWIQKTEHNPPSTVAQRRHYVLELSM